MWLSVWAASPLSSFLRCATERHCCPQLSRWETSGWRRRRVEQTSRVVWGGARVQRGARVINNDDAASSLRRAAVECLTLYFKETLKCSFCFQWTGQERTNVSQLTLQLKKLPVLLKSAQYLLHLLWSCNSSPRKEQKSTRPRCKTLHLCPKSEFMARYEVNCGVSMIQWAVKEWDFWCSVFIFVIFSSSFCLFM